MKMQLSCGCCEDEAYSYWRRTMHCVGLGDVYAVLEHDVGWSQELLYYSNTEPAELYPNYCLSIDTELDEPNITIGDQLIYRRLMQPLRFKMGRGDVNPFEGGDAVEFDKFLDDDPVASSSFCPPVAGHSKGSVATQLSFGVPFATRGGSQSELKYYRVYLDGDPMTPLTAVTGNTSGGELVATIYGWSFGSIGIDIPDGVDIHGKTIEIDFWIQFELQAELLPFTDVTSVLQQAWAFNGTFLYNTHHYFIVAPDGLRYNARNASNRGYKFTFSEPFLGQDSLSTRGNGGFSVSRTIGNTLISRDAGGGYCDLEWSSELATIKLQNGLGGIAASYMPENSNDYNQLSPWGAEDYPFQRPGIFKPHLTTTFLFRALSSTPEPWSQASGVDPTEFGFPNSIIVGRP